MSDSNPSEVPCTSLPCAWKKPRNRKEAKLQISDVVFQMHVYSRKRKHTLKQLNGFDPRPEELRGSVNAQLPQLLRTIKDKSLCMSMLFDPQIRHWEKENIPSPTEYHILSKAEMLEAISSIKETLHLTPHQILNLEMNTVSKTASHFGIKHENFASHPLCLET